MGIIYNPMKEVKRYDLECSHGDFPIRADACEDGDYIKYEDVEDETFISDEAKDFMIKKGLAIVVTSEGISRLVMCHEVENMI